MSIIRIKGRKEPINVAFSVAVQIKQRKFGDSTARPPVVKALSTDILDLGDIWAGQYGQILEIEINDRPRANLRQIERPKMTPEQREALRKKIDEVRKHLEMNKIIKTND
jgi:hypothetical protein